MCECWAIGVEQKRNGRKEEWECDSRRLLRTLVVLEGTSIQWKWSHVAFFHLWLITGVCDWLLWRMVVPAEQFGWKLNPDAEVFINDIPPYLRALPGRGKELGPVFTTEGCQIISANEVGWTWTCSGRGPGVGTIPNADASPTMESWAPATNHYSLTPWCIGLCKCNLILELLPVSQRMSPPQRGTAGLCWSNLICSWPVVGSTWAVSLIDAYFQPVVHAAHSCY